MAKALGSSAILSVSTDSGANYTAVGKVKSVSLPGSINIIDVTDNDDSGTKTQLPGDSSFKLSVTCNWDPSDTAQVAIKSGAVAKTLLYFRYRERGTGSGLPQEIVQVYLDSASIESKHEAIQEFVFSGVITAGTTRSNQ